MRDERVGLPAAAGEIDLLDRVDEGVHRADDTPPCLHETAVGEPGVPMPGIVRAGPGDRRTACVAWTFCCETAHGRHLT
jgi:hypothetical protein